MIQRTAKEYPWIILYSLTEKYAEKKGKHSSLPVHMMDRCKRIKPTEAFPIENECECKKENFRKWVVQT